MRHPIGNNMSWWDDIIDYISGRSVHPDKDTLSITHMPVYSSDKYKIPPMAKVVTSTTYKPYKRGYSSKAFKTLGQASKLYTDAKNADELYNGSTFKVKPKEWANSRAGDSTYFDRSYSQMLNYVQDSRNGWLKNADGTYKNRATGQVFDPKSYRKSADYPVTAEIRADYTRPAYHTKGRYAVLGSPYPDGYLNDVLGIDNFTGVLPSTQDDNSTIHNGMGTEGSSAVGQSPVRLAELSASHEINHGLTAPYTSRGLIRFPIGVIDRNGSVSRVPSKEYPIETYAHYPSELVNSASLFQQQLHRNTGSRITNKDQFWDKINEAKQSIEDYDPESRRFLQNVDELVNNSNNSEVDRIMLNQLQEAMPLISKNKQLPGYNTNYKQNMIG